MYLIKFYLAACNIFTTRIYFFYLLGKKINVSPPLYLHYVFTLREPNIETNVRRRYEYNQHTSLLPFNIKKSKQFNWCVTLAAESSGQSD
jgi:hypothetical protein